MHECMSVSVCIHAWVCIHACVYVCVCVLLLLLLFLGGESVLALVSDHVICSNLCNSDEKLYISSFKWPEFMKTVSFFSLCGFYNIHYFSVEKKRTMFVSVQLRQVRL